MTIDAPPRPAQESTPALLRATTGGHRKKVVGVRSWQLVESSGQVQVVEAGKHAIMRRTGLPARDLRILDPVLSYPSTVLGRERAVVVNLEHIKAIITAHEVLFLNAKDPLVTPFVTKLQGIFRHRDAAVKSIQEAGGDGSNNADWKNLIMGSPGNPCHNSHIGSFPNEEGLNRGDEEQRVGENARSLKLLPFEFVALEACLEAACTSLDDEATRLEQEAHPALDRLTSKVSPLNLERVRQIKSRLVAITGRVQKVRDELEHLLDDDEDMAEMYLTDKLDEQEFENSSAFSVNDLDEEVVPPDVDDRIPVENMGSDRSSVVSDILEMDNEQKQTMGEPNLSRIRSHGARTSTYTTTKSLDVEELEMILEAYFVQIEGTLNKLSNLREYVDDTEDYLNIMLDDKQNHLLQMGVMLSTATVVVSAFVALSGVFGMNIHNELFDEEKAGMPDFLWTVGGGFIGCVFMYAAAFAWYKHKRLV